MGSGRLRLGSARVAERDRDGSNSGPRSSSTRARSGGPRILYYRPVHGPSRRGGSAWWSVGLIGFLPFPDRGAPGVSGGPGFESPPRHSRHRTLLRPEEGGPCNKRCYTRRNTPRDRAADRWRRGLCSPRRPNRRGIRMPDDKKSKMTRRSFLHKTAVGAAAVGAMAAAPTLVKLTENVQGVSPPSGDPTAPLMAYVKDPAQGTVDVMWGTREFTARDPALVSRLTTYTKGRASVSSHRDAPSISK